MLVADRLVKQQGLLAAACNSCWGRGCVVARLSEERSARDQPAALSATLGSSGPVSVPSYSAFIRSAPSWPSGPHRSSDASVAA